MTEASTYDHWLRHVAIGLALLLILVTVGVLIIPVMKQRHQVSVTRSILAGVRTVIELNIGGKGEIPPLNFSELYVTMTMDKSLHDELNALHAIDVRAQAFVDAWGRPLSFRLYPSTGLPNGYELRSAGPDGILGTADDVL